MRRLQRVAAQAGASGRSGVVHVKGNAREAQAVHGGSIKGVAQAALKRLCGRGELAEGREANNIEGRQGGGRGGACLGRHTHMRFQRVLARAAGRMRHLLGGT
eukprot:355233-Chlamydomonas_euryale.AAC.5